MGEKPKRPRKNYVCEVDIATLLQRYNATTVLTLLQEVAQVQDCKIDWDVLAKNTSTGISNPREYQMLWRHLAYRDTLLDKVDNVTQPLDDDSDLECELEACPAVSSDAMAEAAACVKVLIASGGPSDPTGSTMEAPLTINIPKSQMSKAPDISQSNASVQGTNIMVPISVQKQSLTSASSSEVVETNSGTNANLPRRKRKPWSAAEDMELIAAVEKFGEGNWANILKSGFKGDRTASQLSQRWAIIRKRKVKQTLGSSSQHSEAQLAANRAVTLALQDIVKSPSSIMSVSPQNGSAGANGNFGQSSAAETSSAVTSKAAPQPDAVAAGQQSGLSKSRVAAPKKPTTKSTLSPDSMVKAAAVAAGARIATPSDAATLLKAVQSKNAHHIKPGASLLKSGMHFFRTGMGPKPLSAHSSSSPGNPQAGGMQQVPGPTKMATPTIQPILAATAPESTSATQVKSATMLLSTSKAHVKTEEDSTSIDAASTIKEQLLEHQAGGVQAHRVNEQTKGDETSSPGSVLKDAQEDQGNLWTSIRDQFEGGQTPVLVKPSKEPTSGGNVSATTDALIRPAQGRSDAPSSDMAASNGHTDQEATTKSEGARKDNMEHTSVELTFDDKKEICEINNTTQNEEGCVPMEIDGNDGQKNVKEPEVQNGLLA